MKRRWPIRAQLFGLVLVIATPLIGLLAYTTYTAAQDAAQQAGAAALGLAQLTAANIRQTLSESHNILSQLAKRPLVQAVDPGQCDPLLMDLPHLYPEFVYIVVVGISGQPICPAVPAAQLAAISEQPWFQAVRQSQTFTIGPPQLDRTSGKWLSALAYPIQDEVGQQVGLLVAPVALAHYQTSPGSASLPAGAIITVMDNEGTVIARSSDSGHWVGQSARGSEIVDIVLATTEGQTQALGLDRVERVYGFTTVPLSPGWRVYAGIPVDIAFATVQTNLVRNVLLSLGIILAIIVLAGYLSQKIGQPIRRLAQAARAVTEGRLDSLLPIEGPQEVAEVAREFNAMIVAHSQAEQALRESERRFRQVVISIGAHIYVTEVTAEGRFINRYLSPHVEALTGYPLDNFMADRNFWPSVVIHPDDRAVAAAQSERLAQGQSSEIEYRLIQVDGQVIWVRDNAQVQNEGNSQIIYGVVSDITRQKHAEESLRRYAERLHYLREIDRDILAARSPTAIAQMTLKRLRQLIPCRRASTILFDFEQDEAVLFAIDPAAPAGLCQPLRPSWLDGLNQEHTVIVEDSLNIDQPGPLVQSLIAEGIRSYINIPLVAQDEMIGIVNLASDHPGAFNSEHIEVAMEVANQLAVALQQTRLYEQVASGRTRLEALSRQLLEAQETERRHLARELHDEIGQSLSMIKIDLQTIQYLPQASSLTPRLAESLEIIEHALQQVRALSVELRPSLLDDLGLIPALRWYVDRQAQRGGLSARFVADPLEARLIPELETVCYRIAQEALTNVVRYAQARRVEVELRQRQAELWLTIRDDGVGFDAPAALSRAVHGGSLGLLSMQERTLLVGGQLEIESTLQVGTTIRACLPLKFAPPAVVD